MRRIATMEVIPIHFITPISTRIRSSELPLLDLCFHRPMIAIFTHMFLMPTLLSAGFPTSPPFVTMPG